MVLSSYLSKISLTSVEQLSQITIDLRWMVINEVFRIHKHNTPPPKKSKTWFRYIIMVLKQLKKSDNHPTEVLTSGTNLVMTLKVYSHLVLRTIIVSPLTTS